MGNDLNIYRSIVKQRGLNEIPYQRDIVTNPKLIKRETSPMKQWYDLANKLGGKK